MPVLSQCSKTPRRRVAVVGAGPGGISTAIAMHQAGHEVRLFERAPQVTPLGGAVLLSLPVLSIMRSYGIDIDRLGAMAVTEFRDWRGRLRVRLPFNAQAEQAAGLPGWHYGMLRAGAIERGLEGAGHQPVWRREQACGSFRATRPQAWMPAQDWVRSVATRR